ncbi:hypothetical protein HKD25_02355 [Gluconobacter wancherniae]|nr:hypothetical protein [Gluconobacter wancherniae]MBF0852890.1 hypothetical protein [Gluconobacter wancherniae]
MSSGWCPRAGGSAGPDGMREDLQSSWPGPVHFAGRDADYAGFPDRLMGELVVDGQIPALDVP